MREEWIEMRCTCFGTAMHRSPPVREEWIEIPGYDARPGVVVCLLPCGRSGLKSALQADMVKVSQSPPVREEWIEIHHLLGGPRGARVSSRAGGVD